jgi:site-specific recombinase XerD
MREELVRRNYAETTMRSYLQTIEDFRRYVGKRLDQLGPDEIRRYQVYLLEERKLGVGTVVNHIAALRFFYVKTLKRRDMKEDLPYPHSAKHTRRLPIILSTEEMSRLIDSAQNLFHYAMLLTMYSAGLRRSELCRLKVSNIDSGRMMIRIERGKGDVGCGLRPIFSLVPKMAGEQTSPSQPKSFGKPFRRRRARPALKNMSHHIH